MNINTWYVTDPTNPANSAAYPYNHPFISSMNAINEWAVFIFKLQDSSGNPIDFYTVGDPNIVSNVGVTNVNAYQTGTNNNIDAEWFTISTSPGLKIGSGAKSGGLFKIRKYLLIEKFIQGTLKRAHCFIISQINLIKQIKYIWYSNFELNRIPFFLDLV